MVSVDFDFERTPLHRLIGEVHRQFEIARSRLPGPAVRFQRLPIIAECASSGLPAARVATAKDQLAADERKPYSAQTFAKLSARQGWEQRRDGILRRYGTSVALPDATTDLEQLGCDWLAIIHADGNGLGQVFLNFDQVAQTNGNRDCARPKVALDEARSAYARITGSNAVRWRPRGLERWQFRSAVSVKTSACCCTAWNTSSTPSTAMPCPSTNA